MKWWQSGLSGSPRPVAGRAGGLGQQGICMSLRSGRADDRQGRRERTMSRLIKQKLNNNLLDIFMAILGIRRASCPGLASDERGQRACQALMPPPSAPRGAWDGRRRSPGIDRTPAAASNLPGRLIFDPLGHRFQAQLASQLDAGLDDGLGERDLHSSDPRRICPVSTR